MVYEAFDLVREKHVEGGVDLEGLQRSTEFLMSACHLEGIDCVSWD